MDSLHLLEGSTGGRGLLAAESLAQTGEAGAETLQGFPFAAPSQREVGDCLTSRLTCMELVSGRLSPTAEPKSQIRGVGWDDSAEDGDKATDRTTSPARSRPGSAPISPSATTRASPRQITTLESSVSSGRVAAGATSTPMKMRRSPSVTAEGIDAARLRPVLVEAAARARARAERVFRPIREVAATVAAGEHHREWVLQPYDPALVSRQQKKKALSSTRRATSPGREHGGTGSGAVGLAGHEHDDDR